MATFNIRKRLIEIITKDQRISRDFRWKKLHHWCSFFCLESQFWCQSPADVRLNHHNDIPPGCSSRWATSIWQDHSRELWSWTRSPSLLPFGFILFKKCLIFCSLYSKCKCVAGQQFNSHYNNSIHLSIRKLTSEFLEILLLANGWYFNTHLNSNIIGQEM